MKTVIRTMLVLFVLCAGVAWTDGAEVGDLLAPPAPEAVEVEPDAAEVEIQPDGDLTAEDLELLESDEVEVDCCGCFNNCDIDYQICLNQGYPLATCRSQHRECIHECKQGC